MLNILAYSEWGKEVTNLLINSYSVDVYIALSIELKCLESFKYSSNVLNIVTVSNIIRIEFRYSIHKCSVSENICDARAARVWHGKICVQNSLSAPTQVFQECWSGPPPSPCRFGQILVFWVELVWTTTTTPLPTRLRSSSYLAPGLQTKINGLGQVEENSCKCIWLLNWNRGYIREIENLD